MNGSYRAAVARIAAAVAPRAWSSLPDSDLLCVANASAGTRHRHASVIRLAAGLADQALPAAAELVWSESPADARTRVLDRIAQAPGRRLLVLSLGGDGTHNHLLRTGLAAPDQLVFLRVPLGSGNDGADMPTLATLLRELPALMVPRWVPCVEVTGSGLHEVAFNIASLGLDAYVTLLHDRWRSLLPGNTYRLLVDLAVLRYDRAVRLGPMQLRGRDGDGAELLLPERARSIVAVGVSGHRTYGDHMRVLPGDENVCVIDQIGVVRKLQLKRQFYAGEHVHEPVVNMHRFRELSVGYAGRLPLQCDGEARWIAQEHFPIRLLVRQRAVQVLAPARIA